MLGITVIAQSWAEAAFITVWSFAMIAVAVGFLFDFRSWMSKETDYTLEQNLDRTAQYGFDRRRNRFAVFDPSEVRRSLKLFWLAFAALGAFGVACEVVVFASGNVG